MATAAVAVVGVGAAVLRDAPASRSRCSRPRGDADRDGLANPRSLQLVVRGRLAGNALQVAGSYRQRACRARGVRDSPAIGDEEETFGRLNRSPAIINDRERPGQATLAA